MRCCPVCNHITYYMWIQEVLGLSPMEPTLLPARTRGSKLCSNRVLHTPWGEGEGKERIGRV